MQKLRFLGTVLVSLVIATTVSAAPKKYGRYAIALSQDHSYFQTAASPNYWALMPYYVSQFSNSACSVASMAMILNALGTEYKLPTTEEVHVTQKELLKKVDSLEWTDSTSENGGGLSVTALLPIVELALERYGLSSKYKAEMVLVTLKKGENALREALIEGEKRKGTYVLANFDQGVLTEDTFVGHFAPIGAYDEDQDRVLVMDPDRAYYEPYWVPFNLLVKSMLDIRGFIVIKPKVSF